MDERIRARARDALAVLPHRAGLAYGPGPAQRLTFLPPASPGDAPAPLLLVIPGDAWGWLRAGDAACLAPYLTARGFGLAALQHRPAGGSGLGHALHDARLGLAWLHGQAASLGIDPSRIFVLGAGRGGLIAALLASGGSWPAAFGLPPAPLAGVALLAAELAAHGLAPRDQPLQLPPPAASLRLLMASSEACDAAHRRQMHDYAAHAALAGCALTALAPSPGTDPARLLLELGAPGPLSAALLQMADLNPA
ncbi:alpha/beta hydrolase [Roseomonas sp. 18066]|uniref:alpha/beta hydrolase n=1 Tax=Roseomonas sp. 18066 TaxID=2681412 RepID=UPI00135A15EF|nr:alpha/beta hydrolase [Roseomonas sp. 18066]